MVSMVSTLAISAGSVDPEVPLGSLKPVLHKVHPWAWAVVLNSRRLFPLQLQLLSGLRGAQLPACPPARAPLAQLYVALSIRTAEPRLHAATTVAVPAKREALLFWTPV